MTAAGKILYGFLFCIFLPALLVLWARQLDTFVSLPLPLCLPAAVAVSAVGGLLVVAGMLRLWFEGKGLPMNAFPPEKFVRGGVYAFFAHPIYFGAVVLCGGISWAADSPSGVYVITPMLALMCTALVWGYEKRAIEKQFGEQENHTFFALPPDNGDSAGLAKKAFMAIRVFGSWLVLYEILIILGCFGPCIDTVHPTEKTWPVIEWTELIYMFTYPFVFAAPFFCRTNAQLRNFAVMSTAAITAGILLQATLPFISSPRIFEAETYWGKLILLERGWDGPAAAFPSFHVTWAFLSAAVFSVRFPKAKPVFFAAAILISLSCISTGAHSVADVLAGILLAYFAVQYKKVWRRIQQFSERLANSWREWHFGSFRIISHAFYSGLAGCTGACIAGLFLDDVLLVVFLLVCALAGAGLWGQFVEGSPKLLRPFGYYGSMLGGGIALLLSPLIFTNSMTETAAALALAAPFTQAAGRLRCLVQGCCHGSITDAFTGIRYTHEKSRVCHISGLKGKYLHNTQLYSIASNLVAGLFLFRLWMTQDVPLNFITGLYFILNGLSRFVEESFRGEVQTKITGGLRIYQWAAIGSVAAGIGITWIPSGTFLPVVQQADLSFAGFVLLCGLITAFLLSMDFPKSKKRFSRLSG